MGILQCNVGILIELGKRCMPERKRAELWIMMSKRYMQEDSGHADALGIQTCRHIAQEQNAKALENSN